jgi:hypothetical protein
MQQKSNDFLRYGGNGQYVLSHRHGRTVGQNLALSLKSFFPNYSALRADFSNRLDKTAAENARMLLNALTLPDTVPNVTDADLRDVSDAKEEALNAWDTRLENIFNSGPSSSGI